MESAINSVTILIDQPQIDQLMKLNVTVLVNANGLEFLVDPLTAPGVVNST